MPPKSFQHSLKLASRCARALTITASLLVSAVAHAQDLAAATPAAPSSATTTAAKSSLSFGEAIGMALEHSGVMGIAKLNEWRSFKAYQEVRNHYLPQL